ncbi:unnamed protein product, partial [Allacma fusca]
EATSNRKGFINWLNMLQRPGTWPLRLFLLLMETLQSLCKIYSWRE